MEKKLSGGFGLRMFFAVLFLFAAFLAMETSVWAAVQTGTVGSCKYSFDTSTGVLTLTGSGTMGIEGDQYYGRTDIKKVIVSEGITDVSDYAFRGCSGLVEAELADSVTDIGYYAFQSCNALKKVNFPEGLTLISAGAFSGCTGLSEVRLSSTVTKVGKEAFINTGLKRVSIPPNVTTIVTRAFGYTDNSTAVENFEIYAVPGSAGATYASSNSFKNYKTAWSYDSAAKTLTIYGTGEMDLPTYAFNGNTDIKKAIISQGVTTVGKCAFYGCYGLDSVSMASTVTEIGSYAFEFDDALVDVEFPEGLKYIRWGAFYGCKALKRADMPSTLLSIAQSAFANTGLKIVSIPPSVTSVGDYAVGYNYNDSTFTAVEDFEICAVPGSKGAAYASSGSFKNYKSAWSYDSAAKTLTLYGTGTMDLPRYVFDGNTDIKKAVISQGLTSVGGYVFYGCYGLESVSMASTVTEIGSYAFEFDNVLVDVEFPEGLKYIRSGAFYGCEALDKISLPQTLSSVGIDAFANTGLESVIIMPNVTTIDSHAFGFNHKNSTYTKVDGFTIFGEIPSKAKDYADQNDIKFSELNGSTGKCSWRFDASTGTLTVYGSGQMDSYSGYDQTPWYTTAKLKEEIKKVVIENGVTNVGSRAFDGCTALKELSLSDTVRQIGIYAFRGTGLVTLETGPNMVMIYHYAFYGCKSLKTVSFHEGLKGMGNYSFYGATALDHIVIPESVTMIGDKFISGMRSGFRVYVYGNTDAVKQYIDENGYAATIMGDLNANDIVNEDDAKILLKYLDGTGSLNNVSFIAAKTADNTKNEPDMLDVIKILKMS